jgi:DNA-binding MarR family transcriptional regulator
MDLSRYEPVLRRQAKLMADMNMEKTAVNNMFARLVQMGAVKDKRRPEDRGTE